LVGGLIGQATGPISSTHATGHVTGKSQVGGLIGVYTPLSPATAVTSSWASGQVDGDEMVGGLVGRSTGKVAFSFASGAVTATGINPSTPGYVFAGGLIGQQGTNAATEDCYASGAVTAPLRAIGGLVGGNLGPVARCSTIATQMVTGSAGAGAVGGLVGDNQGSITLSRAAGSVNAPNAVDSVGGLVGAHTGPTSATTITTSYATGDVTAGSAKKVGGLVGFQVTGSIVGSHAHGTVSGAEDVGGLVGFSASTGPAVNNSHATGAVTATAVNPTFAGVAPVGGLIGNKPGGTVDSSFATGAVTGNADVVGGLIGFNGAAVTKSYAKTGAVSGQQRVGGLVGLNQKTIGISYAANNVSGTNFVGGLVGQSQEATAQGLSDCYATGTVTGNDSVGGLVGRNETNNNVTRCYASGSVSGTTAVGGLIGDNIRTGNSSNYWNASTTGQPASGAGSIIGATGLTSAQMKQQASFVGFNFSSPWSITEGITEPLLTPVPASATPTSTALTSSFNPSLPGQSVTFTATVTGNAPSGTVLFQDGANPLPGCIAVVVAAAQAQCTRSDLALGTHPISALYSGDGLNTGSLSPTLNHIVVPPSLDVDFSVSQSKYDALTDGLLIVRYMSGLTGNALTNGALGSTAGRTSPVAIKSWLDGLGSMLDIDGNGSIDPLTDGVLIIRYLFGLRGDALIAGAVDLALGTRKLAPDIEAWILMLLPPP
ncbi:MAG: Ig-like domain-containing protein, partial [Casimicrobiaceae bacterium]